MTKENIYYMDDNAFDRFYKRARYQANSFVAGKLGSKAADYLTTLPDFAYLICKLMLDYAAVFTPKESFWKRLDVFDWFEK